MRVYRGVDRLPQFKSAAVTIGSFDGVHRGHRAIIDRLISAANESGGESIVITFEPHPRVVLGHGDGLRLLTTLEEKISLLDELGVDNLIVIPFDREFSLLSYSEFVTRYLSELLNINTLVIGYDHHMGRNNEGRYNELLSLSEQLGFNLSRVDELRSIGGENLSSTAIRTMVSRGDMDGAKLALSNSYVIFGQCDSDGRVWVTTPLKLIPRMDSYPVEINGKNDTLTIDNNGIMRCSTENNQVKIKFL